jgi:hypothetical protein
MDISDIVRDYVDANRRNDSDTLATIFFAETVIKTEK